QQPSGNGMWGLGWGRPYVNIASLNPPVKADRQQRAANVLIYAGGTGIHTGREAKSRNLPMSGNQN
ncbi:hypothetical protein, partial [Salmonella enterica]|uniref:hypothetical protein n=1 Tax=Salmonella enterica TaxID=28901 RepID=UPI001C38C6EB